MRVQHSHTLTLGESTASSNLRKGFEKCGLFPMIRQNVLHSLSTYARQGDDVKDFVGQAFRTYVENIRDSDLMTKSVKILRLPEEPGRSVSVEEVCQFEENQQASCTNSNRKSSEDTTGDDVCSSDTQPNKGKWKENSKKIANGV